jgi:hypothetical protein
VPSGQGLIGCGHETNRREREKKTQETEVRGGVRKKMVRMRKDFEDDESRSEEERDPRRATRNKI